MTRIWPALCAMTLAILASVPVFAADIAASNDNRGRSRAGTRAAGRHDYPRTRLLRRWMEDEGRRAGPSYHLARGPAGPCLSSGARASSPAGSRSPAGIMSRSRTAPTSRPNSSSRTATTPSAAWPASWTRRGSHRLFLLGRAREERSISTPPAASTQTIRPSSSSPRPWGWKMNDHTVVDGLAMTASATSPSRP